MSVEYKFSIPIIDVSVMVNFNKDFNKAKASLEKFIGSDIEMGVEESDAFVAYKYKNIGVWMGPNPTRDDVAHESLHIVQDAYSAIGAKIGKEDELDAYFLGFVTKKVFSCLDKHQKRPIAKRKQCKDLG